MGRLLKHRKKDNKWRLWTTISDGWLTGWLTEDEMKQLLASDYQRDYKLRVIEAYWIFPYGWYDRDTQKEFCNWEALEAFTEWHLKALRRKNYEEEVDRKLKELTESLEAA